MCELALTKAQSEKRKVKSAKRKRVLTPLYNLMAHERHKLLQKSILDNNQLGYFIILFRRQSLNNVKS